MSEVGIMVLSLATAVGFVFAGELIRKLTPGLRKIFLPGAVVGGTLALIFGPQILPWTQDSELMSRTYQYLGEFPPMFINVVFACLMLGKRVHSFGRIWGRAKYQIVMGHIFAWGQYVVGFALTLMVLEPFFDINSLVGPSIAIGFQGGHGTAAGLSANYADLGFADGKTIAYAVATFGIVAGAIGGPIIATFLKKRSPINESSDPHSDQSDHKHQTDETAESTPEFSPLTGKLTIHLALVGAVIALGWCLLQTIQWIEASLRSDDTDTLISNYVPLFSIVLITGLATQLILQKLGWDRWFRRSVLDSILAFALDMVIAGALATLTLSVVGEHWVSILVLCSGGILWNLAVFSLIGPRIYPAPWYPYGLGDLGGGTATTASGLLLIRVADPGRKTLARQAYSEKQPFYEPFMGGGLVTALALPLVASCGIWISLGVTSAILFLWLFVAWRMCGSAGQNDP